VTEDQLNKITVGQVLYRFADGVSDSPICMGHMYCVTKKYKNGDLELWHLPEYLGDAYYTGKERRRTKRENFLPIKLPSGGELETYHIIETSFAGTEAGRKQTSELYDRLLNKEKEPSA
jgi:hypothetical protein